MIAQLLQALIVVSSLSVVACGEWVPLSRKSATMGGSTSSGGGTTLGGAGAGGNASMGGAPSTAGVPSASAVTGGGPTIDGGATNASANVKYTETKQLIDGFGVSNAWLSAPSNKATVYDALFSMTKGAGLSILRNRIPFRENPSVDDKFINKDSNGNYTFTANADGSKTFSLNWSNWDLNNTATLISDIKAAGPDYQVTKFLSTPWTPPNNGVSKWKLPSSGKSLNYDSAPEVGGYLDPNHYADYADVLADYALGYRSKMGVDLTALSLQNEPNFQCNYESADWSAEQFHAFIGVLETEFRRKDVFTKLPGLQIMAPEYQGVEEDLVLPTLADTNTAGLLGIVGVHQYEFGTANVSSYSAPLLNTSIEAGKRVWMTEWSSAEWASSTAIDDGLILARLVHLDMTAASMSAFLYWWSWGDGNGALVVVSGSTVTVPKRLYALGQFSRFVRPGWYRVDTTASPASNVYLSAFKDAAGAQVAIIAINAGTGSASLPLRIDAGKFGTLTQYRTSATENIANVGTIGGGATVTVSLPGSSVTTLVGPVTN